MAEQFQSQPNFHLKKEQKAGFAFLVFFAILVIILGALQIRNTMYAPFALSNKIPDTLKDQLTGTDALKYRDTDNDSIKDFDELYVYSTSPYLADTDSDGKTDGTEIAQGTNPLCDETKPGACLNDATNAGAVPEISVSSTIGSATLGSVTDVSAEIAPQDLETVLNDPKQVRQLLLESGMDKTVLDQINDAELSQMIREIMMSSSTFSNLLNNSSTGVSTTTKN